MNRIERWLVHLSNLLVIGTGLIYAAMKYLMEPSDPFSVVNHPWQPQVLTLHLVTAPLLVFSVGILWSSHITVRWQRGKTAGRISGIGLCLAFLPMVLSGYLLQTAAAPFWRQAWLTVHLVASSLWLLLFLAHQVSFVTHRLRRGRNLHLAGPIDPAISGADNRRKERPAA